jgi:hypothetical protein
MTIAVSPATSAVRVGRLNVSCLVSREHPSPLTLCSKIATIAERQLPSACARLLGPLCPKNDPSLWFIRRLDVEVPVDSSWGADNQAQAWSQPVARAFLRAVNSGEDGANVLRFANRAAYVAQFLCDLADGVAWTKWYYVAFDGLRALLVSAAVREALSREPATGESALLQLVDDGRLGKVLRSMNETDCRAVLTAFCSAGRDPEAQEFTTALLQAAWRAWQRIGLPAGEHAEVHHTALRLYLALRNGTEAVPPSQALLRVIRVLTALAHWMASPRAADLLAVLRRGNDSSALTLRQPDDVESLISPAAFAFGQSDDIGSLIAAAAFALPQADDIKSLIALLSCERPVVIEIAEQLRSSVQTKTAAKLPVDKPSFTSFGGIFWLLPHVEELPLEECAAALPDFMGQSSTAVVRFLVLLKCLGAIRAHSAFFDPVLREVADLTTRFGVDIVRGWAHLVTPQMIDDFQARWAASCLRRAAANAHCLCIRSAQRSRLFLLTDCERNLWLRAVRSVDKLYRAVESIHESQFTDHKSPAYLLCDPQVVSRLPATIIGVPILGWNSGEAEQLAAENSALKTCLERARLPDEDLGYLKLTSLLRRARYLDLALSLPARAVLRTFAWRLPGFAWSSTDYLYTNFLDVTATIGAEADRWRVHLSRPPLHTVLAMTGAAQNSYRVSWLNERAIHLTNE